MTDPAAIAAARDLLRNAKYIAVMSGAGVSAESGVPTFRGITSGGLWRGEEGPEVATPRRWAKQPGLVWEFYNYRRSVMADKQPNAAHHALAELERRTVADGRGFHLITQNIDDLHIAAGSQTITRLHGSIWLTRCTRCHNVRENRDRPIAPAFDGNDGPEGEGQRREYSDDEMPRCGVDGCRGIIRPHVVWFGEMLDEVNLRAADTASRECDVFLVVGTSAVVYPAAMYAPLARQRGAKVIEVNLEPTEMSSSFDFAFHDKAGTIMPQLIDW
ncbi:MAG: NAD-dependent deacylase [Planctomycetota bacterium]